VSGYRGTNLTVDLVTLAAGETTTVRGPATDEAVVVLLEGAVEWLGRQASRSSVFAERASAVYVPPGGAVDVAATTAAELAITTTVNGALTANGAAPLAVAPADVVVHDRGTADWRREVHDVAVDAVPAQRLLVGETFNEPGGWSSFPPHKHDGRDGEPALEEVYCYRFDRPEGFGFQGIYDREGNERAELVRHGSVVGFASGFHPVCAAPGYRLYYLWALAGPVRRLAMYEDPAHTWLHDA
jgi:5-deoxy-glucuronate isomerase